MNKLNIPVLRIVKTGFVIASILTVSACVAHPVHPSKPYNSPHHRPSVQVHFEYDYYPDQHVYFDRYNRLYHYHHINLGWLSVRVLPDYIRLNHHRRHHLSYNHNRPWRERHVNKHHYSHREPRHYSREKNRNERRQDRREYKREYRRNNERYKNKQHEQAREQRRHH